MLTNLIEFKSNTAKDPTWPNKSRGQNIRQVDIALEAYWAGKDSNVSVGRELALLAGVIQACQRWLKLKKDKSDYKRNLFGQETKTLRPLFARRKAAVKKLGDAAVTEYFEILQRTGMLTRREYGKIVYDRKKFQTLGAMRQDRRGDKSLERSYQLERESYLRSGKVHALPGAGVGQVFENYNTKLQNIKLQKRLGQKVTSNLDDLKPVLPQLRKGIDNLTVEDYQVLDEFARTGLDLYGRGGVQYLSRDDRMQFMVVNDGEGGMEYVNGSAIKEGERYILMYAMDSYGVLYCRDYPPRLKGFSHFNHSTFRSGGEVICAGTMKVENKRLVMINNESGHYKPTHDNLHDCLEVLAEDDFDLGQTCVEVMAMVGGTLQKQCHNRAQDFIDNKDRQPDFVD